MKATTIRVASWNIGGGILGDSHQLDGEPQIEYHSGMLTALDADIVCLQEAHVYDDGENQVAEIAKRVGYANHATHTVSRSHMGSAFLALGIMSRLPIDHIEYTQFSNPGLTATGPNGEPWQLFDKGFTTAQLTLGDSHVFVVNAHCFPLHHFGAQATDPKLKYVLDPLRASLARLSRRATIACLDLNSAEYDELLPELPELGFQEAFARSPTTPKGVQQDYIVAARRLRVKSDSGLRNTHADHSLCWASLEVA